MKKELLRLMRKKFYIAFIGVKSKFDGIVYSECYNILHRGLPKFKWKGMRPFYILMVSKNDRLFEAILSNMIDYLNSNGAEFRLLYFPVISLKPTVDLNSLKVLPPSGKANFILANKIDTDSGVVMAYSLLSDVKGKKNIILKIPIVLKGLDQSLQEYYGSHNIGIEYTLEISTSPVYLPGLSVGYRNNSLTLKYNKKFTKFVKKVGEVRVNMKLIPKRIEVKEIWGDWTTDNDTLKKNAGKTLYLSETVNFLIKTYVEMCIKDVVFGFVFEK